MKEKREEWEQWQCVLKDESGGPGAWGQCVKGQPLFSTGKVLLPYPRQ